MKFFSGKRLKITVLLAAAFGAGVFAFSVLQKNAEPAPVPSVETNVQNSQRQVLGLSVESREIESFTFGSGKTRLVFVGGIHGGYEWNSVVLAYELIDYLKENPKTLPESLSVAIIPSANPDGVFKAIGKEGRFTISDVPSGPKDSARFNANKVDLNRNFDCLWQPKSMWKQEQVSAGTEPFSEPESLALKKFVLENNPSAVIFWHSQANAVYASKCQSDILPETLDIANAYSKASGYPAFDTFDSYEITGDAGDWLASIGIPAITVELKTHETIEWDKNLAGVQSLFEYYQNKK